MPVKLLNHVLSGEQALNIPYAKAFEKNRFPPGCIYIPYWNVLHFSFIVFKIRLSQKVKLKIFKRL